MFQSPSLRGSGRFTAAARRRPRRRRVSIPFIAGQWSLPPCRMAGGEGPRGVSIPFIAGQWSLRNGDLRCGLPIECVSIPFIAGQWSLPLGLLYESLRKYEFQSPSLRGSGRFMILDVISPIADLSFNPLHCGAVVASHVLVNALRRALPAFQSPSLRGSGRFRSTPTSSPATSWFQSPSLRGSGRFSCAAFAEPACAVAFQSPSLRGSGRFVRSQLQKKLVKSVSIPFIAGQWSLQAADRARAQERAKFQSPSLRGSGRFTPNGARRSSAPRCFNPLHCGAVVASHRFAGSGPAGREVSIPFIAGQWSLPLPRFARS